MKNNLKPIIEAGVPTIFWGLPGVGKTSAIKAAARDAGLPLVTIIASLHDPTDFSGVYYMDAKEGQLRLFPPSWALKLRDEKGILFLDELNLARPSTEAALLRVVAERKVGEVDLHPDTIILAAANPPEYAPDGHELAASMNNRFAHEEWALDPLEWAQNFPGYWGENKPGGEYRAKVAGFISARPSLLCNPPREGDTTRAWASPRAWENACKRMACNLSIAPVVGEAAAVEYLAWEREANLPDPASVIAKGQYDLTGRGDIDFAVLQSVAAFVLSKGDVTTWNIAWKILAEIADKAVDIAATAARTLAKGKRAEFPTPPEVRAFLPVLKEAGVL